MKTTKLSRQEIMRLPEGIKVKSEPQIFNNKIIEHVGALVFQPPSVQEDDEELFGIMRKGEWINFDIKPGNIIIIDPSEIDNPPLWIVRCEYFKPKKNWPEHMIVRVMDKNENKFVAITPALRAFMKGSAVKYFHAKLFSNDIELISEIANPQWQKLTTESELQHFEMGD